MSISDAGSDSLTLDAKLELFDRHADQAVRELAAWLIDRSDELIAVARGRHVTGHYRYRDRGVFDKSIDDLRAEAAEELADGIVYAARQIHLRNQDR